MWGTVRRGIPVAFVACLFTVAICLVLLAAMGAGGEARAAGNPWLDGQRGVLNIAHQGGELEAPSSTLYAFRTALEDRGADMLELDVHTTRDGHLVVLHDDTVDRTTNGTGAVEDMTLEEIRKLDAAYWFSPGQGQFNHSLDPSKYRFRGIRNGGAPPPPGYTSEDFRIPTLTEVFKAFPGVPINVEIKPRSDAFLGDDHSIRTAEHLAAFLTRPALRNRRVIVASLAQPALERFHELAPRVDLSASIEAMLNFISDPRPIEPQPVALQVPISFSTLDIPTMLSDIGPGRFGYALHVFTNEAADENGESYRYMLDSGAQGIMTMAPLALHRYLCSTGMRRPDGSPRCARQRMRVRMRLRSRSLRRFVNRGLPVRVRCSQRCSVRASVRIKTRAARRLKITGRSRRGTVLIGVRHRGKPAAWRRNSVTRVRASRPARKRLLRTKKIRVQLTVTVFDGTGWRSRVLRRWITLRSPQRAGG